MKTRVLVICLGLVLSVVTQLSAQKSGPIYPGCSEKLSEEKLADCFQDKLADFIRRNIEYPADAIRNKASGTVYIRFSVDENGQVKNITNAMPNTIIGYGLEESAIKLLEKLPKMKPAQNEGKPVAVEFVVPVRFEPK